MSPDIVWGNMAFTCHTLTVKEMVTSHLCLKIWNECVGTIFSLENRKKMSIIWQNTPAIVLCFMHDTPLSFFPTKLAHTFNYGKQILYTRVNLNGFQIFLCSARENNWSWFPYLFCLLTMYLATLYRNSVLVLVLQIWISDSTFQPSFIRII